ncbi:hypothetical protein P9869_35540 [Streptomyces ossamyceticus]|nr:hypothetical protein [Streptomyces ossamyceticus]
MSDFPNDQDCDRTAADDQLDRILASADAELLTAISTAQTRSDYLMEEMAPTYQIVVQRSSSTGRTSLPGPQESNGAVLAAEADLDKFVQSLHSAVDDNFVTGPSSLVSELVELVTMHVTSLKGQLQSRALTEQWADGCFEALEEAMDLLSKELYLLGMAKINLAHAKRSVRYLFDHAEEFGGCPVPSRP